MGEDGKENCFIFSHFANCIAIATECLIRNRLYNEIQKGDYLSIGRQGLRIKRLKIVQLINCIPVLLALLNRLDYIEQ